MNATQRWVVLVAVYGLFLAIGLGSLAAVLGWLPSANARFVEWSVAVLFADVIAAGVAVFRLHFQVHEPRAYVNVEFDGVEPRDVELTRCEFVVFDGNASVKKKGQATVLAGPGGWQCQFSWPAEPTDTAQMTLVEQSGRTWKVLNFSPTTIGQRAIRVP